MRTHADIWLRSYWCHVLYTASIHLRPVSQWRNYLQLDDLALLIYFCLKISYCRFPRTTTNKHCFTVGLGSIMIWWKRDWVGIAKYIATIQFCRLLEKFSPVCWYDWWRETLIEPEEFISRNIVGLNFRS